MLRQPISVLVVIYNTNGEFLLIQRADDPNFWQSVTGGVEQGEHPNETAVRELFEETGIDATKLELTIKQYEHTNHYEIRPQWLHRYEPGSTINTEHVFSVEVPCNIEVRLNPSEHLNFVWLSAQKATQKAWSQSNQKEILLIKEQLDLRKTST